ncbi:hypothetical protein D6821_00520 [Candidatus Parcubacteria bacterium]|nr:MAG: hypothetical protein D6821_00520 [Candidatus Parcubacteria bacterium]
MKKRVGIFSFTCDEGCSIYLTEIFNQKLLEWLPKIELAYFLSIKDKQEYDHFDIVLVEGVITTAKDKQEIEKLRAKTDILIAMGSCAVTGQPSAQRNNFGVALQEEIKDHLEKFNFLPRALSIKEAVKVDDQILGCPVNEQKFIEVFEKYLK